MMVVLSKIYTRTGDDGTTALGSGRRVAKYDLRVEAYGTLDETNAAIGIARLRAAGRLADGELPASCAHHLAPGRAPHGRARRTKRRDRRGRRAALHQS